MRVQNRLFLLLLPLCFATSSAKAASDRASDIMREVERRSRVDSQSYQGTVDVVSPKGKVQSRSWHLWQETDRGSSKLRIRFDAPPDMRGVTLLSLSFPNSSKTWLYAPSNRRLRQIAQQEKTQRFMGTDLTQEDIEEHPAGDFSYQLVGEQELAGQAVYKIKAVSRDPRATQYSHTILYVRKDILATTYIEFYIAGQLRKTMLRSDWKQIQGTWTPLFVEVKDLGRGSMTRIRASEVQYHIQLDPGWFTPNALRQGP